MPCARGWFRPNDSSSWKQGSPEPTVEYDRAFGPMTKGPWPYQVLVMLAMLRLDRVSMAGMWIAPSRRQLWAIRRRPRLLRSG